ARPAARSTRPATAATPVPASCRSAAQPADTRAASVRSPVPSAARADAPASGSETAMQSTLAFVKLPPGVQLQTYPPAVTYLALQQLNPLQSASPGSQQAHHPAMGDQQQMFSGAVLIQLIDGIQYPFLERQHGFATRRGELIGCSPEPPQILGMFLHEFAGMP